jgi:hypothetical protein
MKSAATQEELVRAIADELKPWKHAKNEVLAEIRETIENTKIWIPSPIGPPKPPKVGFRTENKRYAQALHATLATLDYQLAAAPYGFFVGLNHDDGDCEDIGVTAQKKAEVADLRVQIRTLAMGCEKQILNPAGADPRSDRAKSTVAFQALVLVIKLSEKKPAAGSRNTSYCMVASLLFEAVRGLSDCNLVRACKLILSSEVRHIRAALDALEATPPV